MRLRGLIGDQPKALADIGGRPFLSRLIEHVAGHGFRRFILCVGYKADSIQARMSELEGACDITVVREHQPLGTGGALRSARPAMAAKTVIAMNGDSFCPVDYAALLEFHVAHAAAATIAVVRSAGSGDVGYVRRGDDGAVAGFVEKPPSGEGWVNAGIYAFEVAAVDELPESSPLSLEREVFPGLVGRGLYSYATEGPLVDIGTPERYVRACETLPDLMRGARRSAPRGGGRLEHGRAEDPGGG